jgi:RHS repeat-associated protein
VAENLIRYTGELLDTETELYDLRARIYDPSDGRFLSVDPVSEDAGDPSVADYVYVADMPLRAADPSGEVVSDSTGGVGGKRLTWNECRKLMAERACRDAGISPDGGSTGNGGPFTGSGDSGGAGGGGGGDSPKKCRFMDRLNPFSKCAWPLTRRIVVADRSFQQWLKDHPKQAQVVMLALAAVGGKGGAAKGHVATVTVVRNGQVIVKTTVTSRPMTAEEKALGFPKNTLAAHTEARAVRQNPLQRGDTMIIHGTKPPCPSCKGVMNQAMRETGAKIEYRWPGGRWPSAKQKR